MLILPDTCEIAIDEVGTGSLCGPVVSAAVIWPFYKTLDYVDMKDINDIKDSKKLTPKRRYELSKIIKQNALAWSVESISSYEIDEINIYNATQLSMHKAIDQCVMKYVMKYGSNDIHRILIDGNKFKPYKNIDHVCIVKGDTTHINIAAASILAKTYRDDIMIDLSQTYPEYGLDINKGYGTKKHINSLQKHGICPHHRKSYNPVKKCIQ